MPDKWVRMTAEEYAAYTANASKNVDAFKCGFDDGYSTGYERGYRDAQYFRGVYSPEELEAENDEN